MKMPVELLNHSSSFLKTLTASSKDDTESRMMASPQNETERFLVPISSSSVKITFAFPSTCRAGRDSIKTLRFPPTSAFFVSSVVACENMNIPLTLTICLKRTSHRVRVQKNFRARVKNWQLVFDSRFQLALYLYLTEIFFG